MTDAIKIMRAWAHWKRIEVNEEKKVLSGSSHPEAHQSVQDTDDFLSAVELLLEAHSEAEKEFKHYRDFAAKDDHRYHANQWLNKFGSEE